MYTITRFNGKGRVLQVLDTKSLAVAKLFCLHNTTNKGETCISDSETGEVLYIVKGQGANMFPKVTYDITKDLVRT